MHGHSLALQPQISGHKRTWICNTTDKNTGDYRAGTTCFHRPGSWRAHLTHSEYGVAPVQSKCLITRRITEQSSVTGLSKSAVKFKLLSEPSGRRETSETKRSYFSGLAVNYYTFYTHTHAQTYLCIAVHILRFLPPLSSFHIHMKHRATEKKHCANYLDLHSYYIPTDYIIGHFDKRNLWT
jgi:hypothetical protein